jgi:hypothetical protein
VREPPLTLRAMLFYPQEQAFDHGGVKSECFSLFFNELFHPGTEAAPNPLWNVDELTKFCWPRRTHPNASAEVRTFIERMWFQVGDKLAARLQALAHFSVELKLY